MTLDLPEPTPLPWPAEDEGEPPDDGGVPNPIGAASFAVLVLLLLAAALWLS